MGIKVTPVMPQISSMSTPTPTTSTPTSDSIQHNVIFVLINKDLQCSKHIVTHLLDSDFTHKIPQKFYIDGIEVNNDRPEYTDTSNFYINLHEVCYSKYSHITDPINDWFDDPEYNTIAIICNDVLAFPDIMFNLTCCHSHPKEILKILDTLHHNLSTALNMPNLKKPQQRFHWYEDRQCIYLNAELQEKKHDTRMNRIQQH
jgi:hypothetical protein